MGVLGEGVRLREARESQTRPCAGEQASEDVPATNPGRLLRASSLRLIQILGLIQTLGHDLDPRFPGSRGYHAPQRPAKH
jgi:hypothetical protein